VRSIVVDNVVRGGTGSNDRSDFGIGVGGSIGEDCWADGNITLGTFGVRPIVTNLSAGVSPPSAGTRDRIGLNVDMITGQVSPGFDNTDNPYIPRLPAGDARPSVAGSNRWRLGQVVATRITEFRDGYVGQSITIIFDDRSTIIDSTGNVRLVGNVFNSTQWSTLTLIYDGFYWIETARSVP